MEEHELPEILILWPPDPRYVSAENIERFNDLLRGTPPYRPEAWEAPHEEIFLFFRRVAVEIIQGKKLEKRKALKKILKGNIWQRTKIRIWFMTWGSWTGYVPYVPTEREVLQSFATQVEMFYYAIVDATRHEPLSHRSQSYHSVRDVLDSLLTW